MKKPIHQYCFTVSQGDPMKNNCKTKILVKAESLEHAENYLNSEGYVVLPKHSDKKNKPGMVIKSSIEAGLASAKMRAIEMLNNPEDYGLI